MLCERFPPPSLRILPLESWRPFPIIHDRGAWGAVPGEAGAPLLALAEAARERPWPALPATLYLAYARDGNRRRYETPYFGRRSMLASLVLAECLEDRGRFLDRVAEGVWLLCEESSWCLPAHVGAQRAGSGLPDIAEPTVDLFAAETAAALAWTSYLLGDRLDRVSPLLVPRIALELRRRVIDPYLERDDSFWMGFSPAHGRPNNWNPWINSNVLAAGLLVEEKPDRRLQVVTKVLRSLDRFLDPYPRDGGCDEGPGYWGRAGASLFDCLETLASVTDGQMDAWKEPLVREMGAYIARAQIAGPLFLNFADASAVVSPPAGVVFCYGERTGDGQLVRLGAWLWRGEASPRMEGIVSPQRPLRDLFAAERMAASPAAEPLPSDVWLPEIEVMAAREEDGSSRGLYVAAKGGNNAESHNHNDIGSFVVYADGRPLIVDAGVGEYTRATFSPDRYSIWTMQSAFHSLLPTVDGIMQAPGASFAARAVRHGATASESWMELDIAGAYPPEAGVRTWLRRIALRRGEAVIVEDSYEIEGATREIVLSLLTPCEVSLGSSGEILLADRSLPGGRFSARGRLAIGDPGARRAPPVELERIAIEDPRLGGVWGTHLERIVVTMREPARKGRLRLEVRP